MKVRSEMCDTCPFSKDNPVCMKQSGVMATVEETRESLRDVNFVHLCHQGPPVTRRCRGSYLARKKLFNGGIVRDKNPYVGFSKPEFL